MGSQTRCREPASPWQTSPHGSCPTLTGTRGLTFAKRGRGLTCTLHRGGLGRLVCVVRPRLGVLGDPSLPPYLPRPPAQPREPVLMQSQPREERNLDGV